MASLIGREPEQETLARLLKSKSAELLAVYGRRRVGKTYLIQTYFEKNMAFSLIGMYQAPMKDQLQQFSVSLQQANKSVLPLKSPANWIEAFSVLVNYLQTLDPKKKHVVFLDEFPWLDGRKSGFLQAFEHFWNAWASRQHNLIVVVCGSAAAWMITNIINNKGGLHGRITEKMPIEPFTLAETKAFLQSLGSNLDHYQILQLYMSFGGIPQYLKTVGKDKSAAQAIERTCFSKQGLLTGEFDNLYNSLFERADNHIKVIRALSKSGTGMTRQEIIDQCGISSGGRATSVLDELEKSGFISQTIPYDKVSRDALYRLIDEFSIFYLRFMDKRKAGGKDEWARLSKEQAYLIWCGIAFEAVCLKHVEQIKVGLKINARTEQSAWRFIPPKGSKEKGAQIDLIIDRKDRIINLCEIKFYDGKYAIDKSYASRLEQKRDVFEQKMKPNKTIFLTMITTFGLVENDYSDQLIKQDLTMDALFK